MAITYSLAPVPKWYIADLVGRPLGGGYLATFSNLDHTLLNPVFEDPAGQFPWPYVTIPNVGKLGILFDENGSQGPFYFAFDPSTPTQLYYLEVYDSNGNLQWTIDNFMPPSGGGGSIITSATDLENLILNNVFYRNLGVTPVSTSQKLFLAPGAHSGLANNASNSAGLYTGPDIFFLKSNTSATDAISFPKFPLGFNLSASDPTPIDYLNYSCTVSGAGETLKCVQFPITQGVQNLSNNPITITIWARGNSGTQTLLLSWFQFYSDGTGATSPSITPIQTLTLVNNVWTKFIVTTTVPNVTGNNLGTPTCGNDGLFLQVGYPLGVTCNIDFTKPCVYVGAISPVSDYHSYDMIDATINSPRTGNVKIGFDSSSLPGYVAMNDGSIGSPTSGATTRANVDTFALYNLLWNNVSNANAPVSGGRGSSAVADFLAAKTLTLTQTLGRALCSTGIASSGGVTTWGLGDAAGEQTHTLTIPEMPSHTHTANVTSNGAGNTGFSSFNSNGINTQTPSTNSTGGGGAHNNTQPSTFLNVFIKL